MPSLSANIEAHPRGTYGGHGKQYDSKFRDMRPKGAYQLQHSRLAKSRRLCREHADGESPNPNQQNQINNGV